MPFKQLRRLSLPLMFSKVDVQRKLGCFTLHMQRRQTTVDLTKRHALADAVLAKECEPLTMEHGLREIVDRRCIRRVLDSEAHLNVSNFRSGVLRSRIVHAAELVL